MDFTGDDLWRIDDPTAPGSAVLEGSFPSGLTNPTGITSHGGSLYVVDSTGDELWRIDDPTAPGSAVLEGSFPSGLTLPQGITSHGGSLYVVDSGASRRIMADRRPDGSGIGGPGRQLSVRPHWPDKASSVLEKRPA